MNMKKEIYKKENKKDFSISQGAIKTTKDAGLYGLKVRDCIVLKGGF